MRATARETSLYERGTNLIDQSLKRVSLYSMLTLDLLAGVFNSSQKCAIAANCITCYFQMCDKYNGYKPGYISVFLLTVVICKLNIIFL